MLSPPPRVLHVITTLGIGGAERFLAQLVPRLAQGGIEGRVVGLGGPGIVGTQLAAAGIGVADLGMQRNRLLQPAAIMRLFREVRSFRPDVVSTWLYHADLLGLVVGRAAGCRCIAWNLRCAELDFARYARTTRWIAWALARLSRFPQLVMHNSQAGRRAHEALGYRPRHWLHVPNGIDLASVAHGEEARAAARKRLGLSNDDLAIASFARLDPAKGWDVLARAVPAFLERVPRARFVLGGRGVERSHPFFARLPADRVQLLGERLDVPELWPAFDFTTLASLSEGWPNVVAESMAACVPVVATRAGDAEDIVGAEGVVVEAGSEQALIDGWLKMAGLSREERSAMGLRARARIRERFDLGAVVERYARIYEALATRARSRGGADPWDDALEELDS
jgi:glycosyltransferase involved in cell wall biosynthesis